MQATARLARAGIAFERTREGGRHLVIRHAGRTFDFWPTTGQWYDRKQRRPRLGIRNLIKELKKCSSSRRVAIEAQYGAQLATAT